jgi:hypothetical protein
MRGHDIVKSINERQSGTYCFVKCWRKEEDFLDVDLIDRFVNETKGTEEYEGVDLLTMDDMWKEVRRISGSRVTLLRGTDGDRVEWVHKGKTGLRTNVCAYTPETLMQIYDVETKGNPIDS